MRYTHSLLCVAALGSVLSPIFAHTLPQQYSVANNVAPTSSPLRSYTSTSDSESESESGSGSGSDSGSNDSDSDSTTGSGSGSGSDSDSDSHDTPVKAAHVPSPKNAFRYSSIVVKNNQPPKIDLTISAYSYTAPTPITVTSTVQAANTISAADATETPDDEASDQTTPNLPQNFTLSIQDKDTKINGLRVNWFHGLSVHHAVAQGTCNLAKDLCPTSPSQTLVSKKGFSPVVIVPGGQDFVVNPDGLVQVSTAHSALPSGTKTLLDFLDIAEFQSPVPADASCNGQDPDFNCSPAIGELTPKHSLQDEVDRGLYLCPHSKFSTTVVYVVHDVKAIGAEKLATCVEFTGFSIHAPTGKDQIYQYQN